MAAPISLYDCAIAHLMCLMLTYAQVKVLGEKGRHARAAVGTTSAPCSSHRLFTTSLILFQAFLSFLWALLLRFIFIQTAAGREFVTQLQVDAVMEIETSAE